MPVGRQNPQNDIAIRLHFYGKENVEALIRTLENTTSSMGKQQHAARELSRVYKQVVTDHNRVSETAQNMARAMATHETRMESFRLSTKKGHEAYFQFGKQIREAQFTMLQAGRIIQDMPFGFVGIANNVQMTAEAFVRLRASVAATGGQITVFQALLRSLAGGGGLLLAMNALTTIIMFLPQIIKLFKKSGESAEEMRERVAAWASEMKRLPIDVQIQNLEALQQKLKSLQEFIAEERKRGAGAKPGLGMAVGLLIQDWFGTDIPKDLEEQIKTLKKQVDDGLQDISDHIIKTAKEYRHKFDLEVYKGLKDPLSRRIKPLELERDKDIKELEDYYGEVKKKVTVGSAEYIEIEKRGFEAVAEARNYWHQRILNEEEEFRKELADKAKETPVPGSLGELKARLEEYEKAQLRLVYKSDEWIVMANKVTSLKKQIEDLETILKRASVLKPLEVIDVKLASGQLQAVTNEVDVLLGKIKETKVTITGVAIPEKTLPPPMKLERVDERGLKKKVDDDQARRLRMWRAENTVANQLITTMKSGFTEATDLLAQGFVQAFGFADNLAGRFFATLFTNLLNFFIMLGLNALFPGVGTAAAIVGGAVANASEGEGEGIIGVPNYSRSPITGGGTIQLPELPAGYGSESKLSSQMGEMIQAIENMPTRFDLRVRGRDMVATLRHNEDIVARTDI